MKVIKGEPGKLAYGRFTKRSERIANILMIPVTIVTIILEFILYFLLDSLIISIIISIFILLVLSLIISYNCNFLQKALNKYYKDFDFVSFEATIQMYLKENLHSETRNDILLQYSNLLLNYDKERALLMWKNVKEPQIKNIYYHVFRINFLIEEEKFDEARALIEIFKLSFPAKIYLIQYEHMKLILDIYGSKELIEDIETKYYYNKNNKFQRLSAYANLLYYYHTRGIKDGALYYAKLIDNAGVGFKEIDKIVEEVLKEE